VIIGVLFLAINVSVVETHLVAKRSDEGGTRLRTEEFQSVYDSPADSLDFLFLGSSTCYCGIDPYALEANGYKSFSLCSSAQRLGNSSDVLDYALTRCTPKTVVIDVYPELWAGPVSSVECERDWIINGPSLPLRRIEPYNLLLKLYFNMSNAVGVDHQPWPLWKGEVYSGLGFIERQVEAVKGFDCPKESHKEMSQELSDVVSQMSQKVDIILVIPPVLCDTHFDISGYSIIDGNLWSGAKDPSNYYDDHHLVASGADSYSGWLAEKLILLTTEPSL
jgi:hypothetical protein